MDIRKLNKLTYFMPIKLEYDGRLPSDYVWKKHLLHPISRIKEQRPTKE